MPPSRLQLCRRVQRAGKTPRLVPEHLVRRRPLGKQTASNQKNGHCNHEKHYRAHTLLLSGNWKKMTFALTPWLYGINVPRGRRRIVCKLQSCNTIRCCSATGGRGSSKALSCGWQDFKYFASLAFEYLLSPIAKRILSEQSHGGTMEILNLSILRALPIPLAPLREQQEIVRRVQKLFALADQIEARFADGKKRVNSITQSVLSKVFRGELVPTEYELVKAEGRSFESAAELLERIKLNRKPKAGANRSTESCATL